MEKQITRKLIVGRPRKPVYRDSRNILHLELDKIPKLTKKQMEVRVKVAKFLNAGKFRWIDRFATNKTDFLTAKEAFEMSTEAELGLLPP